MASAHEISDKGTINRRAVIYRRSRDVEHRYADEPSSKVIVLM
jgi:feruloyl-CoA synthase